MTNTSTPVTATAQEGFPLSPVQRALLCRRPEDAVTRRAWVQVRLHGSIDRSRLERALLDVIARHEVLRTRITLIDGLGQPVQIIEPAPTQVLVVAPATTPGTSSAGAEQAPRGGAPLQAHLQQIDAETHRLDLSLPWLLADRQTLERLTGEIARCYRGTTARDANDEPLQFADIAAWHEDLFESPEADVGRRYWRNARVDDSSFAPVHLSDEVPPSGSAAYRTLPARRLTLALARMLDQRATELGVDPAAALHAALVAALARTHGKPVAVAVAASGRDEAEMESVLGLFERWLPVALHVDTSTAFRDLVRDLKERRAEALQWQDAFDGSDLPGETRAPLCAGFAWREAATAILAQDGFAIEVVRATEAACRLVLEVMPVPESFLLRWSFDAAQHTERAVERLAARFEVLLAAALEAPGRAIEALALAAPGDSLARAAGPARTAVPEPVAHAIAARAAEDGARIAVVCEDVTLSYAALDRRAGAIAAQLIHAGLVPDACTGILLPRGVDVIAAFLGVWQAGGAFVPLDTRLPDAALALRCEEAGLRWVIADQTTAARVPAGVHVVRMDEISAAGPETGTRAPFARLATESLAYGLFTSGSTGRPKLVGVEHCALAHYTDSIAARLGLPRGASYATVSTFASDLGNTAIFPALAGGGCLHIISEERAVDPDALAAYLRQRPVDVLKIVPSHLEALLSGRDPAAVLPRQVLVLGGERSTWALVARVRALAPGLRIFNHYGPTETCVGVLTTEIAVGTDVASARCDLPLGTPLSGVEVEVVDLRGRAVPVGVPGELWIGGVQLARGYLGQPALSAQRFVPAEASAGRSRRYRTGDRARLRADGLVEFLGRKDDQIKIRGVRIELGEIERVLAQHPAVTAAAVRVFERSDAGAAARGEPRLIGYFAGDAEPDHLDAWMREHLAAVMVPEAFVRLRALPLTPNGKLDRNALSEPPRTPGNAIHVEPEGEIERRLAAIFAEVLGLAAVSATTSFFALGGHSLLATSAISRIREAFGIELELAAIFDRPTVRELARAIAQVRQEASLPPLVPAERVEALPLSFAQRRLWLLDRLAPSSRAAYTIPVAARVEGSLDLRALHATLHELVRRHEILRTTFAERAGEPVQVIAAGSQPALEIIDIAHVSDQERERALAKVLRERVGASFDLEVGPLLRTALVRLGPEHHVLLLVCHHLVFDAWSRGILLRELTALYRAFAAGETSPLAPLEVQYADFAIWQRDWLSRGQRETQLAYWRDALAGAPAVLELPADRPRLKSPTYRGGQVRFSIPDSVATSLEALAQAHGATLFMVLLAGFKALLHRLSGARDLVVGTAIANRRAPQLEPLMGFFTNTLVLRTSTADDPRFCDFLALVRETAMAAYARQDLPFEDLVEALPVARNLAVNPLFQVFFTLHNTPMEPVALEGLTITPFEASSTTAKFDLSVLVRRAADGIVGSFEYAQDLFEEETVERWSRWYGKLLEEAVRTPEKRLGSLELGDSGELAESRAVESEGRCVIPAVHQMFEAQAKAAGARESVRCGSRWLSYGELDRRANQLARKLREVGVGLESRVGICVERSVEQWVAMLGVWKAGGAYVPLEPGIPRARKEAMVEGSGVRLVLAAGDGLALPEGLKIMRLEAAESYAADGSELGLEIPSEALAYVLYTSGSTGRPKGVGVSHGAAVHLLDAMGKLLRWDEKTVMLSVTTLGFDISLLERMGPLVMGGRTVLAGEEACREGETLCALLEESNATVMQGTPATWRLLQAAGWPGSQRVTALCGGEALASEFARWLRPRCAALWNVYGPTETTVWSTAHRVEEGQEWPFGTVSIGRGLGETRLRVVDAWLRPVPVGVWGELVIGGPSVARGYERRASETALHFVPDPLGSNGERLYRTGDICRMGADGVLEYGGRRDGQVKLRGFRIETGEIEAVLLESEQVASAAVILATESGADGVLVAFVVGRGGQDVDTARLRVSVAQRLPAYMAPSRIEVLAEFPLTSSGKVDRNRLAERARGLGPQAEAAADEPPQNAEEQALAAIFAEVLGVSVVGRKASFFDLGGHSLLATQAVVRVRERLGVELALRALFEEPTVAGLAERVRAAKQGRQGASPGAAEALVARERPASIPLSYAQERLWFVEQLRPGDPAYVIPLGLRLEGELDPEALRRALYEVVRRHEVLRTTYVTSDGRPEQRIHAELLPEFSVVDLSSVPAAEREAQARQHAQEAARQGFDLTAGPLVRLVLMRLESRVHLALLTMHHIASDGWSTVVLARELTALYAAFVAREPSPLRPLRLQYADWALHERRTLDPATLERELAYWRETLAGAPARLLAPDVEQAEHVACAESFAVSEATAAALEALAQERRASLFMVCLAAFKLLLSRESGIADVSVGTDVAHRTHRDAEALIGFFVNLLVLRTRIVGHESFAALVDRVSEVCLSAYEHQGVPFSRLAAELGRASDGAAGARQTPIFQVLFVFQNLPTARLVLPSLEATMVELAEPTAKFDLALFLRRTPGGLKGTWRFDGGRFDPARIQRLSRRLEQLLATVARSPERTLDEIDVVTDAERRAAAAGKQEKAARRLGRLQSIAPRPVRVDEDTLVVRRPLSADVAMPYLVEATGPETDLADWAAHHREWVDGHLSRHGAILFRGGAFHREGAFARLAEAVCGDLFTEYGDLPRSKVGGGIYGSTPYPNNLPIHFHNESSHLTSWPARIVFGCVEPSSSGGETPLADGRVVLAALPPAVRKRFAERGLCYVRNFVEGLDVRWQDFFGTDSTAEVETRCRAAGMELEWTDGGGLRVRQRRTAITQHPVTGEAIWFNQIALHHVGYLQASVRDSLLGTFSEQGLPRHVTFGDGSPIGEEDVRAVHDAYERARVQFPWQRGDVLLVDNMLVAHGRNPFAGQRRIIVAMGGMRTATHDKTNS